MASDGNRQHRQSIRLRGYDYTQPGAYFVTICAQDRACLFGDIANGEVRLNAAGRMVSAAWTALPVRFPAVDLDEFVVMPNHIHAIMLIVGAPLVGARTVGGVAGTVGGVAGAPPAHSPIDSPGATTRVAPTVGDIVGAFKSLTTMEYGRGVRAHGWPAFRKHVWHRNYYEHVIRDEASLNRVRQYILDNPLRWAGDRENPCATDRALEASWLA